MERAEKELESGPANLIAFSKPFINNPDLDGRFANGWLLLKELDMNTFYSRVKRDTQTIRFIKPDQYNSINIQL